MVCPHEQGKGVEQREHFSDKGERDRNFVRTSFLNDSLQKVKIRPLRSLMPKGLINVQNGTLEIYYQKY